jgi:hypothetical protein
MFRNSFPENRAVYEIVEKSGGAIGHNMTHRRCMLDKQDYTQAHAYTHVQICNTYRFSSATTISLLRCIVALNVYCLSCLLEGRKDNFTYACGMNAVPQDAVTAYRR